MQRIPDPRDGRGPDLKALRRLAGGSLFWLGLAFLLVMVTVFMTIRVGRVTGEEVGIMLNRISGQMTAINQPGVKIYNGITHEFHVLDKTLQTLEMTELVGQGDRSEKDDLKIKTVDGSDVYVDLKVQYRIDPDMADVVIATSGPRELYKEKWARDYVRSITRNYLGELTTEDFYDSSQRDVKTLKAKEIINERLSPFGLMIDQLVIPRRPHFYEEYEEMIKKKKLADQEVLQEASKALAAKELQQTEVVTETNKKNVAVEQFTGQMEQLVIQAKAEAERTMKEADAYHQKVTIGAEAALYEMTQSAEGILAKKTAEAEGIEAMREALEGEGGRNMVKMEYAKKLENVTITGQPFTVKSNIERFEHLKGAISAGRPKEGEAQ
jgi:regulator of protease activity HflC (stomatin/prohibitin superfamily)